MPTKEETKRFEEKIESISNTVKKIAERQTAQYNDIILQIEELKGGVTSGRVEDNRSVDELYDDARKAVVSMGVASTSFIQRKLGIGYSRSAKLIDMLEAKGVIGPSNGAKLREVL